MVLNPVGPGAGMPPEPTPTVLYPKLKAVAQCDRLRGSLRGPSTTLTKLDERRMRDERVKAQCKTERQRAQEMSNIAFPGTIDVGNRTIFPRKQ